MKTLVHWISKATPYKAMGLLAIGASMLICSSVAEQRIAGVLVREITQFLVIAGGLIATAILLRRRTDSDRRSKGDDHV